MNKQTALITGASSGIGLELSKLYAKDGYDLVVVSRRKEVLDRIASELIAQYGISVRVIAKDLSLPSSPDEIYNELLVSQVNIDVLVNNAGFGNYGFFPQTDTQTDLELMQVNIVALTHLTKLFLPSMIERSHGRIFNIASMASFMSGPYMNTYFASKAYVLNFSVALAVELEGTGVAVSCYCPGPTDTDFGARAHYDFDLKRKHKMSAEDVAFIGYKGCNAGKLIVVPSFKWRFVTFLSRLLPRRRVAILVKKLSGF